MPHKDPEARRLYNQKYHAKNYQLNQEAIKARMATNRQTTQDQIKAYRTAYRATHKEEISNKTAARTYGASLQQITRIRAVKTCQICGIRPATEIDHDHETGEIRGHLCKPCNVALSAWITPDDLNKAIQYLKHPPRPHKKVSMARAIRK